ncbi:MAG: branched-chain amino acid ABC transporter permease [Clostridiales bacterium]|jgi:branched-chain amino acid transport system permease protein|nr:branched-chain amino acid ABC transporter permease [Clostridiales bacterium]
MLKNEKRKAPLLNFAALAALFALLVLLMESGVVSMYVRGIIVQCFYVIIMVTSLNLTMGFLGQLTLGHAGFMAVGAYTSALVAKALLQANILTVGPGSDILLFLICMPAGALMAALFGILVGIPALRLRGDYLAIITLGFGEIIRVLIQNLKFAGSKGLAQGQAGQALIGIPVMNNVYVLFWIASLCVVVMFSFVRSKYGRTIMAIREDDIAASSVGLNNTYYKVFTFTISAMFAGIAGAIFAFRGLGTLSQNDFSFLKSTDYVIMVVLGGMGSLTGSVVAAIVLSVLPELLRAAEQYRMLVYSVVLILVMIFRPAGLLGVYEFSIRKWLPRLFDKKEEVPKA